MQSLSASARKRSFQGGINVAPFNAPGTPSADSQSIASPRSRHRVSATWDRVRPRRKTSDVGTAELVDEVEELHSQLAKAEEEVERQKAAIKKSNEIHRSMMSLAEEQIQAAEQNHQEEKSALVARWQSKLAAAQEMHQKDLMSIRNRSSTDFTEEQTNYAAAIAALQVERNELSEHVAELQATLAAREAAAGELANAHSTALQIEIDGLRAALDSMQCELDAEAEHSASLVRQLEHEREHRARLKDRCDELESRNRRLSEYRSESPLASNFSLANELAGSSIADEPPNYHALQEEISFLKSMQEADIKELQSLHRDLQALHARIAAERSQMIEERKSLKKLNHEHKTLRQMYEDLLVNTVEIHKYNELKTAYRKMESNCKDATQLAAVRAKDKAVLEVLIKTLQIEIDTLRSTSPTRTPVSKPPVERQPSMSAVRDESIFQRSRQQVLDVLHSKAEVMEASESLQSWKLRSANEIIDRQKAQISDLKAELTTVRSLSSERRSSQTQSSPSDGCSLDGPTQSQVGTAQRRIVELESELRVSQQEHSSYRIEAKKLHACAMENLTRENEALEEENEKLRTERDKYKRRVAGYKSTRSTASMDKMEMDPIPDKSKRTRSKTRRSLPSTKALTSKMNMRGLDKLLEQSTRTSEAFRNGGDADQQVKLTHSHVVSSVQL